MLMLRKPTHPGEVLREDVIKPLGLTVREAAGRLKVSTGTLSAFLNGKIPLRPNLAVRIAKATKTSPESWLNMQIKLDIWKEEQHIADEVEEFSKTAVQI